MVQINFDIPDHLGEERRAEFKVPLDDAAREAFVIEAYRSGKLGLRQVASVLGLETRIAAQRWLAQHDVPLNYSLEDIEIDRRNLAELFPEMRR